MKGIHLGRETFKLQTLRKLRNGAEPATKATALVLAMTLSNLKTAMVRKRQRQAVKVKKDMQIETYKWFTVFKNIQKYTLGKVKRRYRQLLKRNIKL